MSDPEANSPKYRIGTVAQLARLSTHTIRAWERRHHVVTPRRSEGGTRLYTDSDVTKLSLLKALTQCGEPIGMIAPLDTDTLRERLRAYRRDRSAAPLVDASAAAPAPALDVGILEESFRLGEDLAARAPEDISLHPLPRAERALMNALRNTCLHALIMHLDDLGEDPRAGLRAITLAAPGAVPVLVYEFTTRRRLVELAEEGARLIKGPVTLDLLCRTVRNFVMIDQTVGPDSVNRSLPASPGGLQFDEPAAPRRFSDDQLARLRETPTRVECECPNHLASIITSLSAFETYSNTCEHTSPQDAEIHRELGIGTGHARQIMEDLLARLCEHDNIEI